jgi:hypothetical protein
MNKTDGNRFNPAWVIMLLLIGWFSSSVCFSLVRHSQVTTHRREIIGFRFHNALVLDVVTLDPACNEVDKVEINSILGDNFRLIADGGNYLTWKTHTLYPWRYNYEIHTTLEEAKRIKVGKSD